jgi:hypothetical protein
MNRLTVIASALLFTLVVGGAYMASQGKQTPTAAPESETTQLDIQQVATVYKSPTCGCCLGHVEAMNARGIKTEVIVTEEMDAVKAENGIGQDHQACHTTIMGDYFIEGHVPMEAIDALMADQPAVDGIGLARMPSGSPGMPGPKSAPFAVYQAVNGTFSDFMSI